METCWRHASGVICDTTATITRGGCVLDSWRFSEARMLVLKRLAEESLRERGRAPDEAWIDIYDGGRLIGSVRLLRIMLHHNGRSDCPAASLGFEGFDGLDIHRRESRQGKEATCGQQASTTEWAAER